jgi:hypothetical protein
VHHVKEDKARNYLHSKLTDTVSSDMLAYQKHDDSQSDDAHEGLRRRQPLTHFQVHCRKKVCDFPVPSRDVTNKLSLAGNNSGKSLTFFYSVGTSPSYCKEFCKKDIVFRFSNVFFQIVLKVLVFFKGPILMNII